MLMCISISIYIILDCFVFSFILDCLPSQALQLVGRYMSVPGVIPGVIPSNPHTNGRSLLQSVIWTSTKKKENRSEEEEGADRLLLFNLCTGRLNHRSKE